MVEPATPPPAAEPETPPAAIPPPATPPAPPAAEPPKAEAPPAAPPVTPEAKKETLLGAAKIVPEKYELKIPDGSPLDKEALARVEDYAKANKLSNEEAQKLLEVENTAVKAYAEKTLKESEAAKASWLDGSKNDKEIGGDKLARNVELSRRVVDKFGSPLLKQIFNETGTGNHPELIRMLSRIGDAIGEDQLVIGKVGSPAQEKPDPAKKLFPNQK